MIQLKIKRNSFITPNMVSPEMVAPDMVPQDMVPQKKMGVKKNEILFNRKKTEFFLIEKKWNSF